MLESLVLQCCPVIVGGDLNIHVEDPTDSDAQRLAAIFDAFDMQQHVTEPTHLRGGTLDLVATFSDYDITSLTVDPAGVISDHSLVTCTLPSRRYVAPPATRCVRSWQKIDRSAFTQAIKDSCLGRAPSPSLTADDLFTVLRSIADRLAPVHEVCSRVRPHSPWFLSLIHI